MPIFCGNAYAKTGTVGLESDGRFGPALIAGQKTTRLFRGIDTRRTLTGRPTDRNDALRMIKRRAPATACREPSAITAFGQRVSPPTWKAAVQSKEPKDRQPRINVNHQYSTAGTPAREMYPFAFHAGIGLSKNVSHASV